MARWFRRGGPSSDASSSSPAPARGGAAPSLSSLSSSTNGHGRAAGGTPSASGTGTPEEQRFAQVYAADRVGPMPYPNQATPDVGAARGRVRQLVGDLVPHAVDEGTGAALDPLIASWTSGWLSRVDSQHADHYAVIDRLVGGARQQLAEAEAAHERDRRALEIARRDYAEARERLLEPVEAEPPTTHRSRGSDSRDNPARRTPTVDRRTAAGSGDDPTEAGATYRPGRHGAPDQGPPEPATGPLPVQRPTDPVPRPTDAGRTS